MASVIVLILCLSLVMTLVFTNKAAMLATYQLAAAHLLQGEVERIRADRYENVVPANYPDVTPETERKLYLDTDKRVPVTVRYDILSTFQVLSATGNSVTVTGIPTNSIREGGTFADDELTSNIVVVTSGKGITQRGLVKSNTANTIHFTADTTGETMRSWDIVPDATSVVQLNMGKVVTVRMEYTLRDRHYSEEMRTLVVLPLDL